MSQRKTRSSRDNHEELKDSEPANDADKSTVHFTVPWKDRLIICERHHHGDALSSSPPALIFTHGAGGGITAPATRDFAEGFGAISSIICYEGTMNLPNRIKYFHTVIEQSAPQGSVSALGGRSMGARAAVLTALESEHPPEALVLVSYPLMAGPKGDKREPERREQILLDLPVSIDVLFIVGDRDAQCSLEQLRDLRSEMKAQSWLVEVKGADHGMDLKGKNKAGAKDMRLKTGEAAAEWLEERSKEKRYLSLEWNQEGGEIMCSGWQGAADSEMNS